MLTILIVEDEPMNAEVLKVVLEAEGHQVVLAMDAVSGLAAARSRRMDLVLMDLLLPGSVDGVEAVRQLRGDPTFGGAIVCQSARCSEADRKACFDAGADAYLTKPFKRKDVLGIIEELARAGRLPARPEP